ncbi:hyaluronidase-1 isoform X3 [Mauremys reevesii]|uniref:hyaluronidase-1 isoform X3 n=1 Tax=Mauremys reevesii TaxID=260615 RepID=UPI00193FBE55|nr:hyaluronidase-1 isoform X3 [Mauremys reevesii]
MAATAFLLPWACLLSLALVARSTADGGPVLWNRPFVTVWNAPSQECSTKYHVPLDLGVFDVVLNRNESFLGQEIALFYSNTLGLYPHYTPEGMAAHGGIPQNGSLLAHLGKARHDIQAAISEPSFRGLAVIDWESWRPVWARNWDAMELYKEKSQELVREQHLDWPPDRVAEEAQEEFEQSARAFMEQTLALGKSLRPGGFWGFYGFPSCYNYDFKAANYTGECPAVEQRRNEQLWWLWNQSRALYPSIYLPKELRLTDQVGKFVRHRVAEAFRVQGQMGTGSLSVLPYARIQYDFTEDFLSQESCLALKEYVDSSLGHYIMNVTSSATLCSVTVCSSHGRCVRRAGHPGAFLHLSPSSFTVQRHHSQPHLHLQGQLAKQEQAKLVEEFSCQCYTGWAGTQCEHEGNPA